MAHKRSIVFGVAGGTGSGKTTVARQVAQAVEHTQVAYLPHDAYYCDHPQLSFAERARINYDHPDSLQTDLLVEHIRQLLAGESAAMPVYDFNRHRRTTETIRVDPRPIILVEGILVFSHQALRDLMDIRVYVEVDADVRLLRRIERDMVERGRSLDSIVRQYLETVRPMHLQFVEPSKRYADVIIPEGGMNTVAMAMVVSRLRELLAGNRLNDVTSGDAGAQ